MRRQSVPGSRRVASAGLVVPAHNEAELLPACLAALLLIPAFLRDPAYNLLARYRYRWFGRLDACRVPTPEVRARFLD